jgi:protoporphyrinogen/coproporphyrinogen III oxidase
VAVIGGGISGLTTAWTIANKNPDVRVLVLESGDRLGGKIRTEAFADGYVETGADSFVAREPWAFDLCNELGLSDELRPPEVFGALLWVEGSLRRLPPNLLYGIPTRPRAVMQAPLSLSARLRALKDLSLPGPLEGPDISVSQLVHNRFGPQVLERLVDPLLGGTRAGLADEMSLAAALPQVDAAARSNKSVMKGLAAQKKAGNLAEGPPPFLSLEGGLERLVDRLKERLQEKAEVRTNWRVDRLTKTESGFQIAGPENLTVDHVVVTTPAHGASELLSAVSPAASRSLASVDYVSTMSVTLSLDNAPEVPPRVSGILVPRVANMTLSAITWWSVKWPNSNSNGFVARCFIGRNMGDPSFEFPDDKLIDLCLRNIKTITGSQPRVLEGRVDRWERGMPIYRIGHLDRVVAAERALENVPGLEMTGAGLRGSGIPDCVRQARAAAERILSSLGEETH